MNNTPNISRSKALRYGVAVLAVALALLLTLQAELLAERTPFAFFFAAVIISTWYGGRRPGLLTIILSALVSDYFIIPPLRSLTPNRDSLLQVGTFVLVALLINWLAAARQSSEKSLRESEERYRLLFERNPLPMWVYDLETLRFLAVNEAAIRHYGYSREEFLAMTIKDIRPVEDVPTLLDVIPKTDSGFSKAPGTWRHLKKDGTIIDIEITSHTLVFGERRAELVLVNDITERKRTETDRQVISDIIEGVNTTHNLDELFVIIYQALKKVVFAKNCFIALYDKRTGLLTMEFFVDQYDTAPPPQRMGRGRTAYVFRTGRPILMTKEVFNQLVERGDVESMGTTPAAWLGVPLKTSTETIGVLVMQHYEDTNAYSQRDLDFLASVGGQIALAIERKRTEEERERFFAVGADLLFIAGFDGWFKWVGPAWERALGWDSEELTSRPWLHFVHPEDHEKTIAEAEKLFAGRETVSFENRYRHKDGSYRWISWRVQPYVGEQLLYGAATDVTERRQLEEQFRQSQKLESVGQLAGGIAHDFNNLLTVITGYSDLLLRRADQDVDVRAKIDQIKGAAERAATLTRQLLAFSRKQVMQPKVIDLTQTVANMDKMLQRLIGEDVLLVTMLDPKLAKVKIDPGQIEQVLMNLAVNARDAMPGGGRLTIETRNVYLDEAYARHHIAVTPGPYVILAVSDTGQGMDAKTQERIFEPFFTTKEPGKGTGLGLAMVYGIVKQSGGNIWVYSEPGHGSTFKIYLPIVEEEAGSTMPDAAPEVARGTETILLVEDEEVVRELLCDILEDEGYTVLAASHGGEALQICERHRGPIHLLVTDVVMPGMSGRQLVERLTEACAGVKVLYMSGYTDNAIVHHGVLDPDVAFLQKPFTPDAVARKVREVLDSSS